MFYSSELSKNKKTLIDNKKYVPFMEQCQIKGWRALDIFKIKKYVFFFFILLNQHSFLIESLM